MPQTEAIRFLWIKRTENSILNFFKLKTKKSSQWCAIFQWSRTGELEFFTYHHHRRPDSFRDALPQLCGGARFVEPTGKLPRFGWSRSHGVVHLSLGCLLPKRPGWQVDSKGSDKKGWSPSPRAVRCAKRRTLAQIKLPLRYYMPLLLPISFWKKYPKTEVQWWKTLLRIFPKPGILCPVCGGPRRKQTRPLRQCGNSQ